MLDEDTHLSLNPEGSVIGSVPLRNVPSKSVRSISRSNRKNLAVHVSLSSIFTMSKSGPREPLSRATSTEAELPNFWEQEGSSGLPAAPLPYPEIAGAAAARPRRSALAGYMADLFGCQQRKMTKPTKIGRPFSTRRRARSAGIFSAHRRCT